MYPLLLIWSLNCRTHVTSFSFHLDHHCYSEQHSNPGHSPARCHLFDSFRSCAQLGRCAELFFNFLTETNFKFFSVAEEFSDFEAVLREGSLLPARRRRQSEAQIVELPESNFPVEDFRVRQEQRGVGDDDARLQT